MNVDILFASCFSFAAIASFIGLTIFTANLPKEQDSEVIFNSMISSKVIGLFFGLMLIPAISFTLKSMPYASASTIMLGAIAAFSLQRLSNRASVILRKRNYI